MDFNDVIGHERAIKTLKTSLQNNKISHSYLFEGEEGIGKKMVAYAFSKTLLCKEHGYEPCNKCSSCVKFDSGNHPDFFLIEPEKGLIRIDEIDRLIEEVATLPFESKRKVFIIDDSHLMNSTSKNAILKTLEEPPTYVNIILISSNPDNLLPTILSRVQNLKFYPIDIDKISKLLTHRYNITEEEANFIAGFSKGAIGKSIDMAEDQEFFNRRNKLIEIVDSLVRGDKTKAFSSMDFFDKNREDIDDILDMMLYWFRDLLIYKEIGESTLIINRDKLENLSNQSHMNFHKINDIIERIEETRFNIKRNVNYQLAIETMLLNI